MRKLVVLSVVLAVLVAVMVGCGKSTDAIGDDLASYDKKIADIAKMETDVIEVFNKTLNLATLKEQQAVTQKDVLPKYAEFIAKLEEITPDTEEVRKLHKMYIAASNKQLASMTELTAADASQKSAAIVQGLADARAMMKEFTEAHGDLAKAHH